MGAGLRPDVTPAPTLDESPTTYEADGRWVGRLLTISRVRRVTEPTYSSKMQMTPGQLSGGPKYSAGTLLGM